jgi:hypothetical protein
MKQPLYPLLFPFHYLLSYSTDVTISVCSGRKGLGLMEFMYSLGVTWPGISCTGYKKNMGLGTLLMTFQEQFFTEPKSSIL